MALAVQGLSQKRPVYSDKDWDSTLLMHVQVKGAGYNVSCQTTGPEEAIGQGQGQQQHTLNACQVKGAGYNVSCERTGPEEAMGQGQRQHTLNACTG